MGIREIKISDEFQMNECKNEFKIIFSDEFQMNECKNEFKIKFPDEFQMNECKNEFKMNFPDEFRACIGLEASCWSGNMDQLIDKAFTAKVGIVRSREYNDKNKIRSFIMPPKHSEIIEDNDMDFASDNLDEDVAPF